MLLPIQPGDVPATAADTSALEAGLTSDLTSVYDGVAKFVEWYREFYDMSEFLISTLHCSRYRLGIYRLATCVTSLRQEFASAQVHSQAAGYRFRH